MIKNLPKTAHHQSICEANYLRINRLIGPYDKKEYRFETINPGDTSQIINFLVLDKTKHTIILEAKQHSHKKNSINDFSLRIRVSLDARLAETVSYQGERAIPTFLKKSKIQSADEKHQQNRFLTEWLESIVISGIASCEDLQNLMKDV